MDGIGRSEPHNLVLQDELFPLELGDPERVGRGMREFSADFLLDGSVAPLQFFKVRLNGHRCSHSLSATREDEVCHGDGKESTAFRKGIWSFA